MITVSTCWFVVISLSFRARHDDGKPTALQFHRRKQPTARSSAVVTLTTAASDELVLERERSCSGARGHVELREDVLHVSGNGVFADDELACDLLVGSPRSDETKNVELARRQTVR
jgi:hypothetical protein